MISLEDCIGMFGFDENEVAAISGHEHFPENSGCTSRRGITDELPGAGALVALLTVCTAGGGSVTSLTGGATVGPGIAGAPAS